jgi:hypothetical protein
VEDFKLAIAFQARWRHVSEYAPLAIKLVLIHPVAYRGFLRVAQPIRHNAVMPVTKRGSAAGAGVALINASRTCGVELSLVSSGVRRGHGSTIIVECLSI